MKKNSTCSEELKMDVLFLDAKKEFEKKKIHNIDIGILEDSIETMTGQSLYNCIKGLVDRIIELKNQEKEAENKMYFQLGYETRTKEEK